MILDKNELQHRVDTFLGRCRTLGIRTTHQRTEIYRELARTQEHPDADALYHRLRQRIPSLSLDTVYRNLRMLEARGIVCRVGTVGGRARFDADYRPHHHFVCRNCGRVMDLAGPELDALPSPRALVGKCTVESVHVELRGVCLDCGPQDESEHGGPNGI